MATINRLLVARPSSPSLKRVKNKLQIGQSTVLTPSPIGEIGWMSETSGHLEIGGTEQVARVELQTLAIVKSTITSSLGELVGQIYIKTRRVQFFDEGLAVFEGDKEIYKNTNLVCDK